MTKPSSFAAHRSSLLLAGIAFVVIALGAVGVFFLQKPLAERQDIRNQAAVDTGVVQITATPASGSQLPSTQACEVTFQINTQNTQIDGVQTVMHVVTNSSTVNFQILPTSNLQAVYQEVQQVSDGYLISVIAIPTSVGQSFSTNTPTNFAKLTLSPTTTGIVTITFDNQNSIATVTGSNPPQDQLKTLPTLTYSIDSGTPGLVCIPGTTLAAASPTPTPTPTPGVTPTPTPTPVVTPSPTPTPTPGVGGYSPRTCNQACSSNSQCDVNLGCFGGVCRRADNASDVNCAAPTSPGLQRQCNEYCADSRECAAGFTCFYNRCRLPDNPDSSTCGAVTTTVAAAAAKSCNQYCTSNRDCAPNLRCYNNACRWATNPGSLSCTPASNNLVTNQLNESEQKGEEKPAPSVSSTASPSPRSSGSITQQSGSNNIYATTPDETNQTALQALWSTLSNRFGLQRFGWGSLNFGQWSLYQLLILFGILLLFIAFILFLLGLLFRRRDHEEKIVVTKTGAEYEDKLKNRIAELRAQQHAEPISPNAAALKQKVETTSTTAPTSTTPTPTSTSVTSTTTTSTTTSKPSAGTMLQKLRERQIMEEVKKGN